MLYLQGGETKPKLLSCVLEFYGLKVTKSLFILGHPHSDKTRW